MQRMLVTIAMAGALLSSAEAADFQGLLTDWNCTANMVRQGREKTLRDHRNCSLANNYSRSAYGLITDSKNYYKLDDNGRRLALDLLKNSPNKDNLKVVVSGDVQGGTIQVRTMSIL